MYTRAQAIETAVANARMAFDQRNTYADARGSFRDNVVDTLANDGARDVDTVDALAAFDAEAERLFAARAPIDVDCGPFAWRDFDDRR